MIQTAQHSIDGVAVKIVAANQVPRNVSIHLVTGAIYIGPSNAVTSSTGFLVEKAAGIYQVQVDADDELWAIASGGTHTATVLQQFL